MYFSEKFLIIGYMRRYLFVLLAFSCLQSVYAAAPKPPKPPETSVLAERVTDAVIQSDYTYDPDHMTEEILKKLIVAVDEENTDLTEFIYAVATNDQAYIFDILVQVGFISYANQLKSEDLEKLWKYTDEKYPKRIRFATVYAIAYSEGKFSLDVAKSKKVGEIFAMARPDKENSREYYLLTSVLAKVGPQSVEAFNKAKVTVRPERSVRGLFSVLVIPQKGKAMESPLVDRAIEVADKHPKLRENISLVALRDYLFVQTRPELFNQSDYSAFMDEVYAELFKSLNLKPYGN